MEKTCPVCGGAGSCSNFHDLNSRTIDICPKCPACGGNGKLSEARLAELRLPEANAKLEWTCSRLAERGCFTVKTKAEVEAFLNELKYESSLLVR